MHEVKENKSFACDFETLTYEPTRVWAWGAANVESGRFTYGTDIGFFIERFCKSNHEYYFHNLKFDGEFIVYYLLSSGYQLSTEWRLNRKQFSVLIDDMGSWYQMRVKNRSGCAFKIIDSLKFIQGSIETIAKTYGTPYMKGSIDYKKPRPLGYKPTSDEVAYLENDCQILAHAIKSIRAEGLSKNTSASNALDFYKNMDKKRFSYCYPQLSYEEDAFVRASYKGGFTYLQEKYKMKDIGEGLILDVNSLYPSVMYDSLLPIGEGRYFTGKGTSDLFVQRFECSFELREKHIPTLQIKNDFRFSSTEYLRSSQGEVITLVLTSVDLALFLDHYIVKNLSFIDGYSYEGCKDNFKDYVDHWAKEKIEGKKTGNMGKYQASKLMLNSLYGKFGARVEGANRYPCLEGDEVKFITSDIEERKGVYIPVATFITSYARNKTIRSAQSVYDRFIYADTDSLHLVGREIPKNLLVDDYKLGYWSLDAEFIRARYMKTKRYIYEELDGGKVKTACAGLPANKQVELNFENFYLGYTIKDKLQQKRVKGGAILLETSFEL